ncbi:GtrA family protein [Methylomonas paludis]|uniref:GtrA family protein n=1 Tax=Methylomonas paludis TaxID=1173101 RepID=A0A975MQ27_9GAMM|nr:GtrA family protein [Methylomonas paludis]QWF71699.1 GtrA family protein [Methylomonas paludis]
MKISPAFRVFIRYVIGGGLATLIHLLVLAFLVEIYRFNPSLATSLGFCIGTVFNYLFQYHLTFRAKGSHAQVFLRYIIVTVLMMGVNAALFWALTQRASMPYIYAQMLATIVIMFCNFAINRLYTFSHIEHEGKIMNTIKKYRIWLIFLLAFVLRLTVFLLFRPWDIQVQTESILTGDSPLYHSLAQCIVDHFSFCGDTFRTPGYPFFIAVFYQLFGTKPWVVLFAQIFVDLVTLYYVFKIGELLFSSRVGIIAAALFAIDANAIIWAANLYSESLYDALLAAALYYYLYALKLGKGRSFLSAGLLLALTALVKPVSQYYFVILLGCALVWPTKNLLLRTKYALLFGLAFVITISPWLYRNYTLYDTVKLSSVQGENLLFWQVVYARAKETHQPAEVITAAYLAQAQALGYSGYYGHSETGSRNPFVSEAIAQHIAVEYIKTHPQLYASSLISGVLHTYANLGTADIIKRLGLPPTHLPGEAMFATESQFQLIATFFQSKSLPEIVAGMIVLVLLLVNYTTFLMGSYTLFRQRRLAILALFSVSIAYFTATGGTIGLARFRLPITPLYLLIGAVYIDQKWRQK